jgi:hypothetical protein
MNKHREWIGKAGFGFSLVPLATLVVLDRLNPG